MKYLYTLLLLLVAMPLMGQTYIPKDAPKDSVYIENGEHFKAGLTIEVRREVPVNGYEQAYKLFLSSLNTERYAISHSTIYKPTDSDVLMVVKFRKVEKLRFSSN